MNRIVFLVVTSICLLVFTGCSSTVIHHDNENSYFTTKFYLAEKDKQNKKHPLIFLFGGSEGGMLFDIKSKEVQELLNRGYNVATVAYFGYQGLTDKLNHINLNGFEQVLEQYKNNPYVDKDAIGVVGISKGGELVLLLGSIYPTIHAVVAIVPSHVAFQASNITLKKESSWIYHNKEVPFVPYPQFSPSTLKGIFTGNYRQMHIEALRNKKAVERARIKVEKINAPIYLISARYDNVWPSMEMSEEIMKRLENKKFAHHFEHKIYDTDHFVLHKSGVWEGVVGFLEKYLPSTK